MIGVHSPEFPFEKDAGNVADAIARYGIHYPVVQDNDLGTWNAFGNQYWPAQLPDRRQRRRPLRPLRRGRLRRDRGGDPLAAGRGGRPNLGGGASPRQRRASPTEAAHARDLPRRGARAGLGERPAAGQQGLRRRSAPGDLQLNQFAYGGAWESPTRRRRRETARASGSRFQARRVFLVLGSPGQARDAAGARSTASRSQPPTPARTSTAASRRSPTSACTGSSTCPQAGRHMLELRFAAGIEGYAFTFG